MACNSSIVSLKFRAALSSLHNSSVFLPKPHLKVSVQYPQSRHVATYSSKVAVSSRAVTWDDVHKVANSEIDSSDLNGFFEKIKLCNRGAEYQHEFIPFVMEDSLVGYVHHGFYAHLKRFRDVFAFPQKGQSSSQGSHFGSHVTLHPSLRTPEERTSAVANVIKCLGEEVIPGIRNEMYPVVSSFGSPVFFSLERAAAPYFGIKAYGIHLCGYVERAGQKYLWVAKRSDAKPTFPGMLDHLVAGGLPYGLACGDNVVKECEEEAGIPASISNGAISVGAVSYMDIDEYKYKRDVLFCYDLKLPQDFIPENQDGEVESFRLLPVEEVANVIRNTHFFKPNCSVVIIDFLVRHGYIRPEQREYLKLLQSLRCGDCS